MATTVVKQNIHIQGHVKKIVIITHVAPTPITIGFLTPVRHAYTTVELTLPYGRSVINMETPYRDEASLVHMQIKLPDEQTLDPTKDPFFQIVDADEQTSTATFHIIYPRKLSIMRATESYNIILQDCLHTIPLDLSLQKR